MENEIVITAKNIGKKYNITHQLGGYITMRDVLANIIKSPFKFLKQKAKKAVGLAKNEEFWALRNINFEVKKGEVIGVIGRNGAGKSTLLKILSQITPPTEGEIKINGRVGSLLEVGTGFHPELSGRENIFLNGAILGMTRKEIASKFDDIVAFSGIEKFLDTPVKRYSSGMYVRLAFSVAAHMDPDILIIDEVLAVGDAEFQKKCLGKMDEITRKEGRTIIFVSHNLSAIKQLCQRTILLEGGEIKFIGETTEAISAYFNENKTKDGFDISRRRFPAKEISISDAKILENKYADNQFNYGDELKLKIWIKAIVPNDNTAVEIVIRDTEEYPIIFLPSGLRFKTEFDFGIGDHLVLCKIPFIPLATGKYYLDLILAKSGKKFYDYVEKALTFRIINCDPMNTGYDYVQSSKQGSVHIMAEFSEIKNT